MEIMTRRLRIIPLSPDQFFLLISDTGEMERALGLSPSEASPEGQEEEALRTLYRDLLAHPGEEPWYTSWQIVQRAENHIVGSACFMGPPDREGEVEIVYGTREPHRNQGYMTEAVSALCRWALAQDSVQNVIARTGKENYASHRVLEKCNMKQCRETDESFLWKLNMLE